MYNLEQWTIWAVFMTSCIEGIKIVAERWHLKIRLTAEGYAALLWGLAFIIGLVITFAFEADLFLSMTGEMKFEGFVGNIAGAIALAGGELFFAQVWDWKHLLQKLKPLQPEEPTPDA